MICHHVNSNLLQVMHYLTGLTLVDCSASSQTISLLSQVVNLDGCVVLANKKPLTSSMVTESSFGFLHLSIFLLSSVIYEKNTITC